MSRASTIGLLENEWNDFDKLTPATKMLHMTKRKTQPWKTGLPVDFMPPEKPSGFVALGWINLMRRRLFGDYAFLGHYVQHPDPNQERFFFGLLRECVDKGIVTEDAAARGDAPEPRPPRRLRGPGEDGPPRRLARGLIYAKNGSRQGRSPPFDDPRLSAARHASNPKGSATGLTASTSKPRSLISCRQPPRMSRSSRTGCCGSRGCCLWRRSRQASPDVRRSLWPTGRLAKQSRYRRSRRKL